MCLPLPGCLPTPSGCLPPVGTGVWQSDHQSASHQPTSSGCIFILYLLTEIEEARFWLAGWLLAARADLDFGNQRETDNEELERVLRDYRRRLFTSAKSPCLWALVTPCFNLSVPLL